jgi:predicted acyl esterase
MTVDRPRSAGTAIEVPMSDGVNLAALQVLAPASPAPTIVMLTPYRKENWAADLAQSFGLSELGCHIIVADIRGLGGSGGDFDSPVSPREITDGVELLDWVAAQEYCDGRTVLFGSSYHGVNTLLIAARRPPSLCCAVSMVPPTDHYRDWRYRGGIPSSTTWGTFVANFHQHRPDAQKRVLRDCYLPVEHDGLDGKYFHTRSADYVLDQIDVPTFVVGGWYDFFLRGTFRAFEGLRSPKRLLVGNWGHRIDAGTPEFAAEIANWFGYWLHGKGDDPTTGDNVALQAVGSGAWAAYPQWPAVADIAWQPWRPVTAPTSIRVNIDLEPAPPGLESPVPVVMDLGAGSGMRLWGETWTVTSAPVNSPTTYRGPVALKAVLTSADARDLDVHARISLVRVDGTVSQIGEGRLRASHRAVDLGRSALTSGGEVAVAWHPHDRAEPLAIGKPETLEVEFLPINLDLAPGESVRLGLSLVRMDETVAPTEVTLLPETQVLLPGLPRG